MSVLTSHHMLSGLVLAEIEACSFRNKTPQETVTHLEPLLKKYLPLSSNSSAAAGQNDHHIRDERRKDHYSHYILRLAFAGTEDLRRRFARVETMLFKLRFQSDDGRERRTFVDSLSLDWDIVMDGEKQELGDQLRAATPSLKREDDSWFKVHWTRVPELVEHRTVLVRKGKAYVPTREQASMVMTEFTGRLEKALEMTARALPRLDEDDRLSPILNHLSKNFATPDAGFTDSEGSEPGAPINAGSVGALSQHFPSEALRSSAVHLVPQRHRARLRGQSDLLEAVIEGFIFIKANHRRRLQQRLQVQHTSCIRRRGW